MSDYDLVVLGSGPGGYVAAIRAAQLGLKVAIVERENLGGICLNWGCIPTKALLRSAEIYHYMQHAGDYGLTAANISADIDAVVKRSRGVAKQLNQGVTHLMKKNKITVHMGDGKLLAANTLSVTKDGKTEELTAKNIIIATGARAICRLRLQTESASGPIATRWCRPRCRKSCLLLVPARLV